MAAGAGLKHLSLACEPHEGSGARTAGEAGRAARVQRANDHVSGVTHLLEQRGSQLRSLDILADAGWLPGAFSGLRHTTAVETLNLCAGRDVRVDLSCKYFRRLLLFGAGRQYNRVAHHQMHSTTVIEPASWSCL